VLHEGQVEGLVPHFYPRTHAGEAEKKRKKASVCLMRHQLTPYVEASLFGSGVLLKRVSRLDSARRLNVGRVVSAASRWPYCEGELASLDIFVRNYRDPRDPFFGGHFDQWACAEPACPCLIQGSDHQHQCRGCGSLTCPRHEDDTVSICKYCDAFLCLVGRGL